MAGEGAVDADASAGDTAEERVKRDRLVGPEELDTPFGRAAGQRCVPTHCQSSSLNSLNLGLKVSVSSFTMPELRGLKRVSYGPRSLVTSRRRQKNA